MTRIDATYKSISSEAHLKKPISAARVSASFIAYIISIYVVVIYDYILIIK